MSGRLNRCKIRCRDDAIAAIEACNEYQLIETSSAKDVGFVKYRQGANDIYAALLNTPVLGCI